MSQFGAASRWVGLGVLVVGLPLAAQSKRGRNYKPLQPAADIKLIVEKAANGKPISNAAVIFRAERDGKQEGSLEVKTNTDGEAKIDVIEVGSHVSVQVIADGFATAAAEFDVPTDTKEFTIKMEKPRAQVSAYEDNDGRASQRVPGIQEPRHVAAKPKTQNPGTLAEPDKAVNPNDPALQLGAKPEDTAPDKASPTTGSPDSSQNPIKANPSAAATPGKDLPESQTTPASVPKPDTQPPASQPHL